MTKEKLTYEAIKRDMLAVEKYIYDIKVEIDIAFISYNVLIAITVGLIFRNFWVGLAVMLPSPIFIARIIKKKRQSNERKKLINKNK